ncbi:hypothetical protein Gotri_015753 [Gossypium trilobum]|uniref:Uncharacterized protein n=1 Tax=Gossypium trilobum TaxID=34281 RepID=A0A7J9E151_9ROSI|nr:hypothetical protein [Gossypium trilobum]
MGYHPSFFCYNHVGSRSITI